MRSLRAPSTVMMDWLRPGRYNDRVVSIRTISLAAVLSAGTMGLVLGDVPAKKRVAVFDFDSAAAQGGVTMVMFQTTYPNLGKAVADLVITKLVQNNTVSVIERAAIDKLLSEQNLTNSDRTDALTAAKLGRVLGVDGIVLGTITKYDFEDKTTGGGGVRFGGFGGSSMNTKHDYRAVVQISTRLVSPDTAEVLAVAQGSGEIIRKGVKVDIRDMSRAQGMGMGGGNNPIMNEAMDKAIVQLTAQLEQSFPKIPPRSTIIDGLVADVGDAGRLVLNVGSRNGVKEGDRLQVWRPGKEIRDPGTGKILMRDDTLLGDAVVSKVNDISSIAAYHGSEKPKVGDLVKSAPK